VKTYRRAGARAQVFAPGKIRRRWSIFRIRQGIWMNAVLQNTGLAKVQIGKATWEVHKPGNHRFGAGTQSVDGAHGHGQGFEAVSTESACPATVEGYHSYGWKTCPPAWDPAKTGRSAYRMRLVVDLGTGKTTKSPWVNVNRGEVDKDVGWKAIKKLARTRRII